MIRTVVLAGSAALGLSAFASPAAAACDPPQNVYIGSLICQTTHRLCDAEAHWTECHNGGTQVNGWVKDDKADGKCAQVYANFSNGVHIESARACPAGTVRNFGGDGWNQPASDAQVYLRTVPASPEPAVPGA